MYNESNIDYFETVNIRSLRNMQAFPPDFLVKKSFGRIAQKSAETVHLRKIFGPGRQSSGKASILRGGLRQNTC